MASTCKQNINKYSFNVRLHWFRKHRFCNPQWVELKISTPLFFDASIFCFCLIRYNLNRSHLINIAYGCKQIGSFDYSSLCHKYLKQNANISLIPMSSRWNEVQAAMHSVIRYSRSSTDAQLFFQVFVILLIDVTNNWLPASKTNFKKLSKIARKIKSIKLSLQRRKQIKKAKLSSKTCADLQCKVRADSILPVRVVYLVAKPRSVCYS